MDSEAVPEDTVHYRLYPGSSDRNTDSHILSKMLVSMEKAVSELTQLHMWYYEPFQLIAVDEWRGDHPPHFCGSVCYRECVDDEWTVVSLLFSLTEQFHNLVVSVSDGDGQFLLIEAAEHIPKWLNPDTSVNRVFIHSGAVHIIPKPSSPADIAVLPAGNLSLRDAHTLVRGEVNTRANEGVQQVVKKRIQRSTPQVLHRAHCWLPFPAAHVISHSPQLIASAVHALCDRDSADTAMCRRMSHFNPNQHDFVMSEVVFPRILYAKLLHEQFNSPWGHSHPLPPTSSPLHRPHVLGMKLVCGLEILASQYGGGGGERLNDKETEMGGLGSQWSKFLHSLIKKGYFMTEVEGSQLHQQLMMSAREYYNRFIREKEAGKGGRGCSVLERSGLQLVTLLKFKPCDQNAIDFLKSRSLSSPDDDSWLHLSAEDLDKMMNDALGREDAAGLKLEDVVFGMKSFVDKVSSHAGAEFPWSSESEMAGISFDAEQFVSALDKMLQKLGEEEDSNSESGNDSGDDAEEGDSQAEMVELMQQMDSELAYTEVGKTFCTTTADTDKEVEPVDIDLNLVESLLESYSTQAGQPGPASNILHSMGLHLPAQQRLHKEED